MVGNRVQAFQEAEHGTGHDYVDGSPHLKHPELRRWIVGSVLAAVRSAAQEGASPRVLEVGAGHGPLTEHLVAAGARVVVTEMSRPSAAALRARFADRNDVDVVEDPDGVIPVDGTFDAVVYLSVLHHIPDYLGAVGGVVDRLQEGGAFISFQDPLWYPRRPRHSLLAARAVYLAWRVTRGEYRRGVATVLRRLRGIHDEAEPSDMVEYHVVRQGVDERALHDLLASRFEAVSVLPYWSTQSRWGQGLGRRVLAPNTFGLIASGRRFDPVRSGAASVAETRDPPTRRPGTLSMAARLPDFVIIGAQKAASTLLLNSLRSHPQAWLPASEEPYFRDPVYAEDGFAAFAAPYAHRREGRLGLKCPDYLARPEVPPRLAELLRIPDLIVCLRDPVARAVSAYFWKVRWGLLPVMPLDEGMRRILDGGLRDEDPSAGEVLEWGRYGKHLTRYLEFFPREKIMILLDEDLRRTPADAMNAVARQLGIVERGVGAVSRRDANEGVYSRARLRFLQLRTPLVLTWDADRTYAQIPKPRRLIPGLANGLVGAVDSEVLSRMFDNSRPALSAEIDAELREYYRDDLEVLKRLLGRDLAWSRGRRTDPVERRDP